MLSFSLKHYIWSFSIYHLFEPGERLLIDQVMMLYAFFLHLVAFQEQGVFLIPDNRAEIIQVNKFLWFFFLVKKKRIKNIPVLHHRVL